MSGPRGVRRGECTPTPARGPPPLLRRGHGEGVGGAPCAVPAPRGPFPAARAHVANICPAGRLLGVASRGCPLLTGTSSAFYDPQRTSGNTLDPSGRASGLKS